MKRAIALALSLSVLSIDAAAEESSVQGIWQGTVGKHKVMVCLALNDSDSAYYYLHHSISIPLSRQNNQDVSWLECDGRYVSCDKPSGKWHLKPASGNQLEGQWLDVGGKRTLPIRLTRVATTSKASADCEGEAFNASRVEAQKIIESEPVQFDGKRYRKLSLQWPANAKAEVESLRLLEDGSAIVAINRKLHAEMKNDIAGFLTCEAGIIHGQYAVHMTLKFWNEHWISFRRVHSYDCGGAHPNVDVSHGTWDAKTGKEVNLWTWIKGNKKENTDMKYDGYYFNYAAPTPLNKLIIAKADKANIDKECRDALKDNETYQLSLSRKGIVFSTAFPHAAQACDQNIEIPYASLQPFLSERGKAAVASLL